MKSPFPYFGGKSAVAHDIWQRFGYCKNYIEPFFGSGAVLLARPIEEGKKHVETVNDLDGAISNFWRAVKHDPEQVAYHADWPVIERDIEARQWWLVTEGKATLDRLSGDMEAFDAKCAGIWLHGICAWIGGGYAIGASKWAWTGSEWADKRSLKSDFGIEKRLPMISNAGMGINRALPSRFETRLDFIRHMMQGLSQRLRDVRVCQGDWKRVLGDATIYHVLSKQYFCGIFLDPPYGAKAKRDSGLYKYDSLDVAEEVRLWAIERGDDSRLRIALCGYEGEHDMPSTWSKLAWKANGGYGNKSKKGNGNRQREIIWFSPACIKVGGQKVARVASHVTSANTDVEPIGESYSLFDGIES